MRYFTITVLVILLTYLSYIDLKENKIPNKIIVPAYIVAVFYNIYLFFFVDRSTIYNNFLGFFFSFGIMFLISFISKGGLGGGDVKLFGLLGLTLGLQSVFKIILFSTISGALISIFLVLFRIKNFKDSIPFGPFIALGFVLSLLIKL